MEMVDRLSPVFAGVDDDTISAIQLSLARNVCGDSHQMTKQGCVFGNGLCLRGDVLFGNDEEMGRCLRIDVGKGDAEIILVEAVCRDFAFHDLTE